MRSLSKNKRVLLWLCAYPADESISKWQKCANIAFTLFSYVVLFSFIVLTLLFLKTSLTEDDLEESLYTTFQLTGLPATFIFNIVALTRRRKIAAIFENLSMIHNASKPFLQSMRFKYSHQNVIIKTRK